MPSRYDHRHIQNNADTARAADMGCRWPSPPDLNVARHPTKDVDGWRRYEEVGGELRRDGAATRGGSATTEETTQFQKRLLTLLHTTATGDAIPESPRDRAAIVNE